MVYLISKDYTANPCAVSNISEGNLTLISNYIDVGKFYFTPDIPIDDNGIYIWITSPKKSTVGGLELFFEAIGNELYAYNKNTSGFVNGNNYVSNVPIILRRYNP